MLFNSGGVPVNSYRDAYFASDPDTLLETVCRFIEQMLEGKSLRVEAIGVAIAGILGPDRADILYTRNLGWITPPMPLKSRLEERFQIPVILENDANAAAWAEHEHDQGMGRGANDMIYVTVSTGIGGGFILGNKLYRGLGSAAEIGHMFTDPGIEGCACGQSGHVGASVGGGYLIVEARKRLHSGAKSVLTKQVAEDPDSINMPMIHDAAQQGDPFVVQLLAEASNSLAVCLANLMNVLNPEVIVLGGSMAINKQDQFLNPAIERARRLALYPANEDTRFEVSRLGDDVGLYGAMLLARSEIFLG